MSGIRRVILLHVVSHGETDAVLNEAVCNAESALETIRTSLSVQGIDSTAVVKTGNPAAEIAGIAEREDVSVIWMSSHGRGWFRELLLGSTAYRVAMNAKRPVIVIRKQDTTGTDPQFSPA
jgi:nucleotide-binding universal stress UspA family protein